jgi:lipase maturation factor 1
MTRFGDEPRGAFAYVRTRRVFLRLVGAVYLIAFWSLHVQMAGLFGARGLSPAASFLEQVGPQITGNRALALPTIFWWLGASDAVLGGVALAGMIAAVVLVAGGVPVVASTVLWVLYLSLVSVGDPFLSFQWDALLLETGFLAIFFAPATWRLASPRAAPPSMVVLWLLRLLLFRLMFFSGWVKLASGDAAWWSLEALEYHYWTQPLPTWTSWYASLLPAWAQKVSCGVMFAIELVLPFFILGPRRLRLLAAAGFLALQVGIAATGNYGFFNLLSAILCVPLLDDRALGRRTHGADPRVAVRSRTRGRLGRDVVVACSILALALPLSWRQLIGTTSPLDESLASLTQRLRPFRLVNAYGLFAVMTRTRPEVEVQGSADGVTWVPYRFRWKPGPVDRAPAFIAPDMPRLDWQMWFDALAIERTLATGRGGYDLVTPELLRRLAQASPEVLALLEENPFPDAPPRQLRWQLWSYRFTDAAERRSNGAWWRRELRYTSEPLG